MLVITPAIRIPWNEIQLEFIRASGPGGQNVNKVASAVQLRFDVRNSSIPAHVKSRVVKLAGKRLTQEGILIVEARRFRTQEKNREDALARLAALIQKAAQKPAARIKTNPTKSSRENRLKSKKLKARIKSLRQNKSHDC